MNWIYENGYDALVYKEKQSIALNTVIWIRDIFKSVYNAKAKEIRSLNDYESYWKTFFLSKSQLLLLSSFFILFFFERKKDIHILHIVFI